MSWTLADIRKKVRKLTGRFSPSQLSNQELDEYINNYYRYTFPAEVKLDINLRYYEFLTVPGQEFYTFPSNFTNVEPPIWINGLETRYYINPALYFYAIPEYYTRKTLGAGNALTVVFSQSAQNYPIIAGSTVVSDGNETFTDDGAGVLTGDKGGTGTVNYTTAEISVTFNTAPALNAAIWASYLQYQTGTPQAILLFENEFRLYPIPDSAYHVKMVGYEMPPFLTSVSDEPRLPEWGPAIAYGAARNICVDNGEIDRYAELSVIYKEEIKYSLRRTLQDSMYQTVIRNN